MLVLIAIGLVMLRGSLSPGTRVEAQDAGAESWARLGPPGPGGVSFIAVAPGWPLDRTIVARRGQDLLRTVDGGHTWARLPFPVVAPDADVQFFGFAPGDQPTPPLFVLIQNLSDTSAAPWTLYRSNDAGTSWASVLNGAHTTTRSRLTFSPFFMVDGVIFNITDGRLSRSQNRGGTWSLVPIPAGQRAQQIVLSPDFALDHIAYLAVATRDGANSAPTLPFSDNDDSYGVLTSLDGGQSWIGGETGLEVNGAGYYNVHSLAISPSFSQDSTLLAFAWGPILRSTSSVDTGAYVWSGRIFRSVDSGATWQASAMPITSAQQVGVTFALSPTFSDDGVAFAAISSAGPTPEVSGCSVLRTGDGGASWSRVVRAVEYDQCAQAQPLGRGSDFSLLVQRGTQWSSTPGGLADRLLQRLQDGPAELSPVSYSVASVVAAPPLSQDPTVFVGAWGGGVWLFGPGVESTDARMPCPSDPGPGFRIAWDADPLVHGWLGCPTAAEQPVRVREMRNRTQGRALRAYWTEDADPRWLQIFETFWLATSKDDQAWPDQPYQTLDATEQRFAGGVLFRLPRADGTTSILEIVGDGDSGPWREIAAPPLVAPGAPLPPTITRTATPTPTATTTATVTPTLTSTEAPTPSPTETPLPTETAAPTEATPATETPGPDVTPQAEAHIAFSRP